jgi:arginine decarboxylase
VDVGGGLGIDYDGSGSTVAASVNYSMQEYANDVIYTLAESCREAGLPMPHVISESGRALTAHHALLLINVIDVDSHQDIVLPEVGEDDHAILHDLKEGYETVSNRSVREVYHDATFLKDRAHALFNSGVLSLRGRALAEQLYAATLNAVARIAQKDREEYADIIEDLEAQLVDRYFCNFSVFQSLPDSWAIDQLFPIMPIHRLREEPDCRGILADITCDSDGKVDRFIDRRHVKSVLELHDYTGDDYLIAAFLVGAYQEILGDLHNLLGDTNAVHVTVDETGHVIIDEVIEGDTVREVLQYVQFSADELMRAMRKTVERALREQKLSIDESRVLLKFYENGLEGYTYLE